MGTAFAEFRSPRNEMPHLLQGEIARLDQKFKINYDETSHPSGKTITLLCSIDDTYLPCVPPIFVEIPGNYTFLSTTIHSIL